METKWPPSTFSKSISYCPDFSQTLTVFQNFPEFFLTFSSKIFSLTFSRWMSSLMDGICCPTIIWYKGFNCLTMNNKQSNYYPFLWWLIDISWLSWKNPSPDPPLDELTNIPLYYMTASSLLLLSYAYGPLAKLWGGLLTLVMDIVD